MQSFPQILEKWSTLEYFGFGKTMIQEIPSIFSHMSKLSKIDIRESPIAVLPDDFYNLPALKEVTINQTRLSDLPASFANLQVLEQLNLNFNAFMQVPLVIRELKLLRSLQFARNHIKSIPSWLGDLSKLKELQIEFIPQQSTIENWQKTHSTPFPLPNPIITIPNWIRNSHLEKVQFGKILRSLYDLPLRARLWALTYGRETQDKESPFIDLPQRVVRWLKIAFNREDANDFLLHRLQIYYAKPTAELAHNLVANGKVTCWESERLIHEITPSIRDYLEAHLPAEHPILEKVNERYRISKESSTSIFL